MNFSPFSRAGYLFKIPLRLILLSVFCLITSLNGSSYDPVAVYLTWQRNPESTMTIRWLTDLNRNDDFVEFQKEGDPHWLQARGSHTRLPGKKARYLLHTIELINLSPGTSYSFRTGRDAVVYKFKTMPLNLDEPIRFVAGGDMYHDTLDILHATNKQAAKTNPHFALVGGDIAYAFDKSSSFMPEWMERLFNVQSEQKFSRWLAWLQAWKNDMVTPEGCLIPILPVLGNHDVSKGFGQTPQQAIYFYSLFAMPGPQGYNVLDFGNYMSIFLLDSGHTHPVTGQQTQWLASAISQREFIPNKFALYHVPAYPSVRPMTEEIGTQIRKNWVPYFDRFHLSIAFENHDHDYKRTYPLTNGSIDPNGVLYLGDGAWGVDHPRLAPNPAQRGFLAFTSPTRHFILMILSKNQRYTAAITSEGHVIDHVVGKY